MRTLLVTEYLPYHTDFGAQQRSHLMWTALRELGQVDVLLLQAGPITRLETPADSRLVAHATFGARPSGLKAYAPDDDLTRLLMRRLDLERYDVVCGRYLRPISKLNLPRRLPSVVDLDDAAYTYAGGTGIAGQVRAACKSAARRILERRAMRRFSRYWFVSERDRRRFDDLPGDVLPNVPLNGGQECDFHSSGSKLLFVGALWYGPNHEGIERFLEACWPEIRRAVPGATLRLVGGIPQSLRERWAGASGLEVSGFVRDLASAYAEAALAIAPIRAGGGTNIKVLESLAMGRACATTTYCLEAFRPHFDGKTDVLAAADDAAMAENCIHLLRDPALRESLARRGRRIVAERFNYQTFRNVVHEQVRLAAGGQR